MAQFNLQDYETVEDRLRRLYDMHPDARVITKNLTTLQDRQVSTWVVQAEVWLPISDFKFISNSAPLEGGIESPSELWILKATGLAFEVDGMNGMANKTSALENCETSAIGRALANMNLSGNKRTSREEMQKVARDVTPKAAARNWQSDIAALKTKADARTLYNEARTARAGNTVLEAIKQTGESLSD
jgi:hypothetical protein